MVREMLSVLMDGIKDAEMLIWYSKDAKENDEAEWASWFKDKAKQRLQMITTDYDQIMRAINMQDRIRNGDDIAEALKEHIDIQIDKLKTEIA